MEYGYCTGFSTNPHFCTGLELLEMIGRQGFDYVEFPLMNFHSMDEGEFDNVCRAVRSRGLEATVACNFFPGSVRLVGKDMDRTAIASYLDHIIPRLGKLGIRKIILGSGPARTFGPDQSREEAFDQFANVLKTVILPRTKDAGMLVCIEPFERTYCNLIVSVTEGLEFVEHVGDSGLELMVDLYHMLSNNEPLDELGQCFGHIRHVHIAGPQRRVPRDSDTYVFRALEILKGLGYSGTMSFETELPETEEELARVFARTKEIMEI